MGPGILLRYHACKNLLEKLIKNKDVITGIAWRIGLIEGWLRK